MNTFVDYDIASPNISCIGKCLKNCRGIRKKIYIYILYSVKFLFWSAFWSSGQSFWLLIMRSRVRFPVLPWEFLLEGEDSRGDHGLGRLVDFRFKAPPGNTSSYINTHTPSGQRNCASWASQPQKMVTHFCHAREGEPRSPQSTCGGIVAGGGDFFFKSWVNVEKFSGPLRVRLRQVLLYTKLGIKLVNTECISFSETYFILLRE